LKIDPNLAEGHLNLGLAYEQMGRTSLASTEYKQACSLNPEYCKLIEQHGKK